MSKWEKIREKCPLPCLIIYGIAVCAAINHIVFYQSKTYADFFNMTVGAFLRALLAKITGIFPFSVAETILICLPVGIVILLIFCFRTIRSGTDKAGARLISSLLSVLCVLYCGFTFLFASAYRGKPLSEKLGLEVTEVSADELYETAEYFRERAQEEAESINFTFGKASVMPYSLDEMTVKLNEAYAKINEQYDFVQALNSRVKYIALSKPMTYTHISGVYTYYTGEANININFPDYTIPYTAAHEMSHQRGIAAENEANFMAFLVCCASDDAYIRYSGYMNIYEYLTNALYTADRSLYNQVWAQTDLRLRCEEIAYSEFYSEYSENAAATVSSAMNDAYLKSQGQTSGTKSYGMVVDLAVAYVKTLNDWENEA